jgi:hypothetical protein
LKADFRIAGVQSKSKGINSFQLSNAINDPTMSDLEKKEFLQNAAKFDFGSAPHEYMSAAAQLGGVALFDPQLALKWAEQAPDPGAKIWAWLVIAPAIAKHDQAKANVMVRRCYKQISELDQSSTVMRNYNNPPARLASAGLRLVEMVNPELLDECIAITIELMQPLESSRVGSSKEHLLGSIACIARYDRAKAEQLFEQHADDVPLRNCVGLFRGMMALHPEQVWDEYQKMPESDERGTDWRVYVRTRLVPALVEKDDTKFWDALSPLTSLNPGALVLSQ